MRKYVSFKLNLLGKKEQLEADLLELKKLTDIAGQYNVHIALHLLRKSK